VVGQISGTAAVVIEGRVEGEIELENRVVVGPRGEVEGKIVGTTVEVSGKVVGNVRGVERVQVLESGKLEGDVTSARVVIAEGAFFKGKVEMSSGTARQDQRPPPAASRHLEKPPSPAAGNAAATTPKAPGQPGKANP